MAIGEPIMLTKDQGFSQKCSLLVACFIFNSTLLTTLSVDDVEENRPPSGIHQHERNIIKNGRMFSGKVKQSNVTLLSRIKLFI